MRDVEPRLALQLRAGKVGLGTWLGLVAAAVVKVILAFMMIAAFLAFYFLNAPK